MKTNGCRKYEESMARYLHGEILRQEREALEQHLAECSRCSCLFDDVNEADRLLRSLPQAEVEPPPWLHARIMANLPENARKPLFARWAGLAWSLSAASAGAILAVVLMQGGQSPSPVRTAALAPPAASSPARLPSQPVPEPARPVPSPMRASAVAPDPSPAPASPAPEPVRTAAAEPVPEPRVIHEVRIYLYAPSAQRVAVTGDFNGWDAKGVDLKPTGKPGMWEADLELTPGAYAYNFIVDGDMLVPDPNAPNQMPDGFGGTNSILLIKEGAPA